MARGTDEDLLFIDVSQVLFLITKYP